MKKVKLPEGIDYTKYHSDSGLATKRWGPSAWMFLFCCISGRYPIKINPKNKDHIRLKKQFKTLLTSLKDIMPCIFCRESFKTFIKELPIEPYLVGRIELMYWLYLMKDKVNKKLIKQESQCYVDEKRRLKALYNSNKITQNEYYEQIQKFKEASFVTRPTPPFEQILDKYEAIRAVCSKKSLSCVLPPSKK